MDVKYRYGHRPGRRRRTRVLIVMAVSFLILGTVAGFVVLDLLKNKESGPIETTGRTVVQLTDESNATITIEEPTFSLELPADWKEVSRIRNNTENSITWRATKKREDNRSIKIAVDTIPTNQPINKLLPITAEGHELSIGDVSGNCSAFTKNNVDRSDLYEPAKWQGIDFLCDIAREIDNQIGTGSTDGINTLFVTGPKQGRHAYFFLYTDRNIHPNNSIFLNVLRSFRAK